MLKAMMEKNTDYYFSGDDDKLMELTFSSTDNSDHMNPETTENVVYVAKSVMDQGSYGKALLYGYTWQSDAGSLTVDKEGNIVGETYSGSHTLDEWKEIVEKELKNISK